MAQDDVVTVERTGAVANVTLNRPKVRNAFNFELRSRLTEAVKAVSEDEEIRVVVLAGNGEGFCAGADLGEGISQSVTVQIENEYKPFLMAIAESPKIWIAAVNGAAAGIGGALAMTCDLMVMEDDASIYLAFAAIGLIPDGGTTWHLLHAMGYARAFRTIVEGRRIPASECLELGIANTVVAKGRALEEAGEWAERLALGAPLAQATAKRVLRHVGRMRLQDAITLEAKAQQPLTESEDFANAVAAFLAKQKPVFKGK
ncbi:MAG: enoyl-CoA hydratase/isomerase family protein [Nitratireductor sp.]|nr:enoyl-CoA hydratase/isomerase family protein [Nitratireductor sp.]